MLFTCVQLTIMTPLSVASLKACKISFLLSGALPAPNDSKTIPSTVDVKKDLTVVYDIPGNKRNKATC